MPEMILGLDIGSDTIKAVLANAYGRMDIRVVASESVRLEEGAGLEAGLQKIAGMIRSLMSPEMRCVVSLSPSEVMFRQIHLPFHDEGKIKKTLLFELEPLLPVPIEEVVYDYVHLPDDGLLVGACGKEKIRQVIAAVQANLGKVSAMDIGVAALALPLLEQKALAGVGLVLDIGASSTAAVFYEKNALVQVRSFAFGGNTITRALAEDLSCDPKDAEQMKISAAYGTKTGRALAACREFCASLANTIEFMQLNDTLQGKPYAIRVTGGGSLFKELGDELEKAFGVPVKALDGDKAGHQEMDENLQGRYQAPIMNTALAVVKRDFFSHKSFNFCQGEFAIKSVYHGLKKQWQRMAVIAGIILLMASVDLFLDYRWQAAQAGALKKQISLIFKKHYPPPAVMVDPVSQLRTKLIEDRKAYGLDDGTPGVTVLELLKDISGFISPALDIIITHFHYENDVLLLKGEAKKIDDVTNVKNELLKSKYFKNVVISQTALDRDKAKVNFDLRIELR